MTGGFAEHHVPGHVLTRRMSRAGFQLPPRLGGWLGHSLWLAAMLMSVACSSSSSVSLGMSRELGSSVPPWAYDTDEIRFLGLVVEPLCPTGDDPKSELAAYRGMATVADACDVAGRAGSEYVEVRLRSGLAVGRDDSSIDAWDVRCALLHPGLCRPGHADDPFENEGDGATAGRSASPWDRIEVVGEGRSSRLRVHPAGDVSAALLRLDLVTVPVAFLDEKAYPAGTGPYGVDRIWRGSTAAPGETAPHPSSTLDGWITDQVVLRRRRDADVPVETLVFSALGESFSEETQRAVELALDRGQLHAVLHAERDLAWALEDALRAGRRRWKLDARPSSTVLVAAIGDGGREPCRAAIIQFLQRQAENASLLRAIEARPVHQIFPEPAPPIYFQGPTGRSTAQAPAAEHQGVRLLTNDSWDYVARPLADALRGAYPKLQVVVQSVPAGREAALREGRAYDISMLGLVSRGEPPAYFLWKNLSDTGWATEGAVRDAMDLASREAAGEDVRDELAAFMTSGEGRSMVALAAPRTYNAVNEQLIGLSADDVFLRPQRLDLATQASTRAGWWALGFGLFAMLIVAVASLRVRTATARERRLEREIEFFHHEVSSPLSAIKAYADRLLRDRPREAEAIMIDADHALDIVDGTRVVLGSGLIDQEVKSAEGCELVATVESVFTSLRMRAESERVPSIALRCDADDDLPNVRLTRAALWQVLRNLLDNALRYRRDGQLRVVVSCALRGTFVECRVRDWGLGIDAGVSARKIFRLRYRTPMARTRAVAGGGVGLFLTRRILERAGGRIQLARRRDPTEFVLELPIATPNTPHEGDEA